MKRKLLIAVGIVIIILTGLFIGITNGLSEGAKVSLDGVDSSAIPDGSYTGTYEFERWTNTLVVHMKDHKITSIDIEKDIAAAEITNCTDEMFRRVIEAQDTNQAT